MAAFRRRPFRRRTFRRTRYDMQRFNLCHTPMIVGSGDCDSSTTDMIPLVYGGPADPGNTLGPTNEKASLLGFQNPPGARFLIWGGCRFWHEWTLDLGQADIANGINELPQEVGTVLHMLWFIARIPIDPTTLLPAYVPDLWAPRTTGQTTAAVNTGDVQYDLLWTRLDVVPWARNQGVLPDVGQIIASNGGTSFIQGVSTVAGTNPPQFRQTVPYRQKARRALNELQGLFFGVCSHTSGLATSSALFTYQIKVDLYGQAALRTKL